MSPSFYPSSLGSFTSSPSQVEQEEPEAWELEDNSEFFPAARELGRKLYAKKAIQAGMIGSAPPPYQLNALDVFVILEAAGLPDASDTLGAFNGGWNEARDGSKK